MLCCSAVTYPPLRTVAGQPSRPWRPSSRSQGERNGPQIFPARSPIESARHRHAACDRSGPPCTGRKRPRGAAWVRCPSGRVWRFANCFLRLKRIHRARRLAAAPNGATRPASRIPIVHTPPANPPPTRPPLARAFAGNPQCDRSSSLGGLQRPHYEGETKPRPKACRIAKRNKRRSRVGRCVHGRTQRPAPAPGVTVGRYPSSPADPRRYRAGDRQPTPGNNFLAVYSFYKERTRP